MQLRERLLGKPVGRGKNYLTHDFKAELMQFFEEKPSFEDLLSLSYRPPTQRASTLGFLYQDSSHCLVIACFLYLLQLSRNLDSFADQ